MSYCWRVPLLCCVLLITGRAGSSAENGHDLTSLERSYWLHVSLATKSQKGYWGPSFPASQNPTETEIRNATKLLTDKYAAKRLYAATKRGGYPGYDDAAKNMPLPAGRNRLAAEEILRTAKVGILSGFSNDLLILQANSAHPSHDGTTASFYETLKRGEAYTGYYSVPLQEVVDIYSGLKDGKSPGSH